MNGMSDDAKAILLLCGRLEQNGDAEPLQPTEYNRLVRWLMGEGMRPSDLLDSGKIPPAAAGAELEEARLTTLLKRGVQLGFAVENWSRSNIWVICRSDPEYPERYRSHLKDKAPPILFGVGDQALLRGGGLAIVGSRNLDEASEIFTGKVAEWCARKGMPVVSGGARGVDQIAMKSALDAGGSVVGVLADSLLKKSVSRDVRRPIADGCLLLISPYHPEAGFTVGTAMARNKLIYAMADYGLVVQSDFKKGGTWAGATEELKRKPNGRPVLVATEGKTPKGNTELLKLGAVPFPPVDLDAEPTESIEDAVARQPAIPSAAPELPGFDIAPRTSEGSAAVREPREPYGNPSPPEEQVENSAPTVPATVYEAVLPLLLSATETPVTVETLAEKLDVAKGQLQKWLKKAVEDNQLKKLKKPARYVRQ